MSPVDIEEQEAIEESLKKRDKKAFQKIEEEKKEEPIEFDSDCDSDTGVPKKNIRLDEDSKQPKQFKGVMLAENWTPDIDASGYLMSEKLDGV